MDKKLLKIGELAKKTGEEAHTIRFWTKEGLLLVSSRTPGGYSLYDPIMIGRVDMIHQLKKGQRLTLVEIKEKLGND